MAICGCAASIKIRRGLKIGGGLMGGVLRWSQVVKNLPGAGMKISAGSFEIAKGVFYGH